MNKASLLLTLLISLFFVSCERDTSIDETTPPASSGVTGDFRAKIHNTQWLANTIARAERENGILSLTGKSSDGKYLRINLIDRGAGNYILQENTVHVAIYADSANSGNLYSTQQLSRDSIAGGNVLITNLDTTNRKVSGTFNFKVFRRSDSTTVSFTEGSFTNIKWAADTINPVPPITRDTFEVKVDNLMWDNNQLTTTVVGLNLAIRSIAGGGGKSITITVPLTITPGTYGWGSGQAEAAYIVTSTPTGAFSALGGSLDIISHSNRRIVGYFQFPATDILGGTTTTLNFTEGYFAVRY